MIVNNCPKCGAVLPLNSNKCSRCGYVLKASDRPDPFAQEEETAQEVRPSQARFKKAKEKNAGNIFGGGIGNIFGSLFGDYFAEDESLGYDADPKNYDDFGNEIEVLDEFDRESIEIEAIEFVEEDGNNGDKKRK